MATYPIPEYFSEIRLDDEWAIAAVLHDQAVALLYLSDVAPEISEYLDTPSWEFAVRRWAQKATPDFQQIQALGDVVAGIVTGEGFEERWRLGDWQPGDQLPEGA
ncbi:hypothetical protein [Bordetella tumulicola]|uniref:hypothetical protein n=1 Tax=Bordetella tumulicola TaxID=1649133 RepID=UPI0039EFBE36